MYISKYVLYVCTLRSWINGFSKKNPSYPHITPVKGNSLFPCKVNSLQEACTKCFAVHILKFEILQPHEKTKTKTKHQNAIFVGEKLKTLSLTFFVSFYSCDLQDFKFYNVNRKAFDASFLYWVDFTGLSKCAYPFLET